MKFALLFVLIMKTLMSKMSFFNCPYTLGLRFGRVFAGWEVQLTVLSVLLPRRGDGTLVHLAAYSALTVATRWPRAI